MAAKGTIEYTLLFEDDTTQKISVGPYDGNLILSEEFTDGLKSNIINFVTNNFDSDTARSAVSKYGANWAGFSKVQAIYEDKTVLF